MFTRGNRWMRCRTASAGTGLGNAARSVGAAAIIRGAGVTDPSGPGNDADNVCRRHVPRQLYIGTTDGVCDVGAGLCDQDGRQDGSTDP